MLQLAVLLVLFSPRCLSHQNHNLTRSQRALTNPQHTADLRPAGGGRAIVTHRGSTTGGGGARNSSTPRTYDRRGGARNSNTPRTYDRRGCLRKDKYVSDLMLRRTPDRALKKRTGQMATLSVHCAKFAVSMQVATDWCSHGISLFLWRGGRNIKNRYSAFEYRYSIVKMSS